MKKLLLILAFAAYAFNGSAQLHVLENEAMKATVSLRDGSLVGLESKLTGWNIVSDEAYGRSFEVNVKLKDGSFHVINAGAQDKPEVVADGNKLTFRWNGLRAGNTIIDAVFTGHIEMTDKGLVYDGDIDNRSDAVIEQYSWPFIGEISVPENTDRMLFQYLHYTKFNTDELYPAVPGSGWSNLPEHSFTLVHNTRQGLYISSVDHKLDEYIRCIHETLPSEGFAAVAGGADSKMNNGERNRMRTQVKLARMVYVQPYSQRNLVPVILTPYTGTWHAGVDIYKEWRKTWFVPPHRAPWLERVNSWQQLQINSSDTKINFKIKDLDLYVDEARKYGVDAIQLTGWTLGGQDRGLPIHSVDPMLGTPDELKAAIARAEKKGVKILLFTKFTWIDLTADYADDWFEHVVWNPEGDPAIHPGYNYYTATQLTGINTHRFGIFCMMDKRLRQKLHGEFQKCLDLGAPGMVYDENQHHAGAMLCFNPNHGHAIPGFNYQGADLLGREYYEMCCEQNPDFLMTGEGCYDLQSQYYATYTRADYHHDPVLRYIDPDVPIACAIIDHYDKNNINMCFANKYSFSYEVRNFKGHLWEFPRVMAYGKQVDDLRKKYSDYLWNAEFRHTVGATVTGRDMNHTVFVNNKTGKRAVVVYNVNTEESNTAEVVIDSCDGPLVVVSPEKPKEVKFTGTVTIGPQSMIVVMEK